MIEQIELGLLLKALNFAADKISNLRDMVDDPPTDWNVERRREYFDWAKQVIDQLRGVHAGLESIFDQAYARRL